MRRVSVISFIAVALAILIYLKTRGPVVPPPVVISTATTKPAVHPATLPVVPAIASYIDAIRLSNPDIPATQPLVIPLDLPDAAHVIVRDPVYLDPLGNLWITRSDAPPVEQSLRTPVDPSEHLIPERPVFVHWSNTDNGDWVAFVVTNNSPGKYQIISALDRREFVSDRNYVWDRAFSWDGKMAVPSDGGVSIFDIDPNPVEHFRPFSGVPSMILDGRGLIAWLPWGNSQSGTESVARFVDGKWVDLPRDQWPGKIVQLLPLLDGSILQIIAADADAVTLSIAPLEAASIDAHHVADLIDSLSDSDGDKRQAAFDELSRYGPALWPILEQATDQPVEARVRIKQLLRGKIAPALNGMMLINNRLKVLNRQTDGTVLFYAPVGVQIPNGEHDPQTISPAWLAVHPDGRVDRPLPARLVADQNPDFNHLYNVRDDWIVSDDNGIRRFFGNALIPMLKPEEIRFSKVLGVDRRGRWLFQQPDHPGETLVIDPTILDPTPRLPVWTMRIRDGSVGWTADDYPVIRRGGSWTLKADTWEPLPEKTKVFVEQPPSTQPTTQPTPILVTADHTQYFDGRESLDVRTPDQKTIHWPLPAVATGSADPILLQDPDGHLFLFNQPGRVLRIKPTPGLPEPFKLEATFTTDIPNADHPMRIWLDPLGRIDFEYDNNVLAVLFPAGHIPPEISQMMLDSPGPQRDGRR